MATLKFHSTVIFTKDFGLMKSFYQDVLRQKVITDYETCISFENGLSLWMLKPGYGISIKLGYTYHAEGNKNMEVCFETDEFDQVLGELKNYDLKYLHPVMEEDWGQRSIRFFDPENNLVEIGESMPALVRRLQDIGLDYLQISEKTTLPLEFVYSVLCPDPTW